jgi:hypothetical protein
MKRFFSLAFVLLLLLQVAGCYVFFSVRLVQIHAASRRNLAFLPDSDLTRFHFTHAEYEKVRENNREIKVAGRMFDIARFTTQPDGSIIIFAKHDEAEDNLFAFLHEVLENFNHDKNHIPSQVLQVSSLLYFDNPFQFSSSLSSVIIQHYSSYFKNECCANLMIQTPPPKVFSLC